MTCVLLSTSLLILCILAVVHFKSELKSQETCTKLPESLRESLRHSRLGLLRAGWCREAGNTEGSRSSSQWLSQVHRTQEESWCSRHPPHLTLRPSSARADLPPSPLHFAVFAVNSIIQTTAATTDRKHDSYLSPSCTSPNPWVPSERVSFDAAVAGCHVPLTCDRSDSQGQGP